MLAARDGVKSLDRGKEITGNTINLRYNIL